MRVAGLIVVLLASSIASAQATQAACNKSITFAVASNGSLVYRLPNVSTKWLANVQKKFPNVCFPQDGGIPATGAANYLIVLSTQSNEFNGLYPTYRTSTDTTTSPTSGTGTVTDSSGSAWNYTYQGTITSTTTTTTQTDIPYTDTTVGLYASAYSEDGRQVGWARRAESYRQGGDPSNTLGYNLGARLASIHVKEHLLDDIVGRVNALPRADETPHQIGFAEPRPPDANVQNAPATVAPLPASAVSSAQTASAPTSANVESALSSERIAAIRELAASGNAEAQYNLGLLYDSGQGVPQDYAQEAAWYRKAAEQGNANAQTALGSMYVNGQRVPQDNAQAAAWWRKAADQGNADGQFGLGLLYDRGSGVPRDFAEAYFWFDLAAAGNVSGVTQKDTAKTRDDAASHLTPADLSREQERARKWFEDHPAKPQ
jgi:TPR repeat protein